VSPPRWRYPYSPFPKQAQAHAAYADEVLFGGAAGPGKTEWLIAEFVTFALEFPGSSSALFRRTFPDLSQAGGIIPRMLERLPRRVATYHATEHRWTFRNGSTIELGHLQHDKDIQSYMGAEWQLLGFDQVEQFTLWQYLRLRSRLRAAGKVERLMAARGVRPRSLATGNPGGPGHLWVKGRWIDPAPPYVVWRPTPSLEEPKVGTRVFIPGRHVDNPALDPTYVDRLLGLPEDDRRALEGGDWDVFAGQRFRDWRRDLHVVEPEDLPVGIGAGYARGVGVDYGLDHPFAALWGAVLPDGAVVVYRELWGPGLTPTEQAKLILDSEAPGERTPGRPVPVALDPSCWARDPSQPKPSGAGPNVPPRGSIAWHYQQAGVPVRRANNDRLAGVGLVADKLRVREDGTTRLHVYSNCLNLIRTLPALVRDPARVEDVDPRGETDPYDALRYLLMLLVGRTPAAAGPAPRPGERRAGETVTAGLRRKGF
jgi:hypothetical protein